MRIAKTFTIEADVNEYVDETKGHRSASDRVNELLRCAMRQERNEKLAREAEEFFAAEAGDRSDRQGLQKAARRTMERD